MEEPEIQAKNKVDYIKPYQWKKGQSGNIMGRPKGKTMKDYVRQYLERMTDEERDEWLEGLSKETIWEMSEGKPKQDIDTKVEGNLTIQISEDIAKKYDINSIPEGNS